MDDQDSQVFDLEDVIYTQAEVDSESSGTFVSDIKSMTSTTKNILTKMNIMHRELHSLRNSFAKHVETCGKNSSEHEDNSQSLLVNVTSSSPSTSSKPAAVLITTVTFENSEHSLWLDVSVRDALYRAAGVREAVRVLLVAIHGIPFLRKSTRTGLKRTAVLAATSSDTDQSEASCVVEETVIPPVTLIQIHAVVKKIFQFKDTITKDPELFMKEKKRRASDINQHVTSVIQYYKKEYDEAGCRVVKKKQKVDAA